MQIIINRLKNKKIFFSIVLLFLQVLVFSQGDILGKQATLQMQKQPLEEVLASITKQTGIRFSYHSRLIDPKTTVSIQVQNKTVKEILSMLLPAAVSYKKVGMYVVFSPSKEEKQKPESKRQKADGKKKLASNNGRGGVNCLNSMDAENFDSISTTKEAVRTPAAELIPAKTIPYSSGIDRIPFMENIYCLSGDVFDFDGMHKRSINVFNFGNSTLFQAAGIWQVANQSNCQLAGVVNITKKGKFQFGLVNVRDTADGLSLGLINIVKQGGIMEAGIESDEFVHTAIAIRTGVRRLYTKIAVGYNYIENFWTVESGFGTSVRLAKNLNINFELTHATASNDVLGWYSLTQFSPVLNYRFANHFKVYVGPSLNLHVQNDYVKQAEPRQFMNIPYSFFNQTFNYIWAGVVGEIRLKKGAAASKIIN